MKFRDAEARSKGEAEIKQRFADCALNAKDDGGEFLLRPHSSRK